MRLENKNAIITGATGGIGFATVSKYLDEGANVMMVGRSEDKLVEAHNQLGKPNNAAFCVAESTDEIAIKDSIQKTGDTFGSVDIVIANAGTEGVVQPLVDYSVEDFNHTLVVNVTGVWLYFKYAIPQMENQGYGSIVAVASGAGVVGFPGLCPYSASKHAVCGMVKTACLEYGEKGIRFNALAPGPIDNRMMESLGTQSQPDDPSNFRENVTANIPSGRYGTNEEMANLALFLGSDESSYCNGSVYLAAGGFTAA